MINGIVEIHSNNVLHNDLKPENIFINKNSGIGATAKIGDFGLARMLNSQIESSDNSIESYFAPKTLQTDVSLIGGTEAYMAPEIK
jgi:serine/threonine protein kinase